MTTGQRHLQYLLQFLLTRPSRDVTNFAVTPFATWTISTHTSLAGRDKNGSDLPSFTLISTQPYLAGRFQNGLVKRWDMTDFYSHVPRGT